jgi:hypothetical protein
MAEDFDALELRVLRRVPLEILAAGLLAGLGALLWFEPRTGLFVLAGAATAALGFVGMRKGLGRVLARRGARALRAGLALFGLRLGLILLVLSIIILAQPRKLPAFAVGFSTVIPVFFLEALRAFSQARSCKN